MFRFAFASICLVLLAVCAPPASAGPPNAKFTVIGPVNAYHLSEDGTTVVGGTQESPTRAYRWTAETGVVLLNPLDRSRQSATGVSGDGSIVVAMIDKPFRWTEESGLVALNAPEQFFAGKPSADGRYVVGHVTHDFSRPVLVDTAASSFVVPYLPNGKSQGIGYGISSAGDFIVGTLLKPFISSTADAEFEAFRWDAVQGTIGLGDLPGGIFYSRATDVSADGTVVIGESISAASAASSPFQNDSEGFYWKVDTGMVGIGDLPGGPFSSVADAISADGSVIVGTSNSDRAQEAIIYDCRHGMRSLQDVLVDKYGLGDELAGWQLERAFDVSADGRTIVGMARDPQNHYTAWVVQVPEPSTYALAFVFIVAAIGLRRRR